MRKTQVRWSQAAPDIDQSDERLMQALRQNDVDALGLLMDRHWSGLFRYAVGMRGCPDEAEELAQEVFVRVWEHRERWTAGGSAQSYLYRIMRNLVLLRSRHEDVCARAEDEIRLHSPRVPTPAEVAVRSELREAFEDALRALPERRREAFLLVRMRELGLEEAAEIMEVTKRTVANHVYLAAQDLEKALRPFLA